MKPLDQCRDKRRLLHYSLSTERNYLAWIEQHVRFSRTPQGCRPPRDLGAPEAAAFLTSLAMERDGSASAQDQPLAPNG